MIDRRNLLKGIGGSAVAAVAASGGALQFKEAQAASHGGLVPDNEEAEDILYEIARLDARYYTEEGVAMVLSCEDLAAPGPASFEPTEFNRQFSAAFQHYADVLGQLRSDLATSNVATVVELLAWRDLENRRGTNGQ